MPDVTYHTLSKKNLLRMMVNRDDAYAVQLDNGGYRSRKKEVSDYILDRHIKHEITIGTYTLAGNSTTNTLIIDIDSHLTAGDTEEDLLNKQIEADINLEKLRTYLDDHGYPYLMEKSGSPHSYHIWIPIVRTSGLLARKFGKHIMESLNIDAELYPKANRLSNKLKYGNLVKLPLGKNRKNGNISKIFIGDEYVSDFEEITIGVLDISDIYIPVIETKKEEAKHYTLPNNHNKHVYGVRRCVENMIMSPLHGRGDFGHLARICVVREYASCGITNEDALARLFSNQLDFDMKITKQNIVSILKTDMARWRCATIKDKCGDLVDCNNCMEHSIKL